jgi:hypothetical protein
LPPRFRACKLEGYARSRAHPVGIGLGDPHAAEQRLPLVYEELRQLAAQKISQEKPEQTLDATAAEAAQILGIAVRTADRLWAFPRAWLHRALTDTAADPRS